MESGRPLASSPEPFFLHMASSKANSSPAPPQKLHTKSRATPSPIVSSPITISGMYRQYRESFTLDLVRCAQSNSTRLQLVRLSTFIQVV